MSEYSVVQFFVDDSYEKIVEFVEAEEAVRVAMQTCRSVGAKIGTTKRVIITDGGDFCAWEWIHGRGIVFPPEVAGKPIPE